MGWIESKSMRLFLPAFTDESVDREFAQSIEVFGEVIGCNEVVAVTSEQEFEMQTTYPNPTHQEGRIRA